ncbi:hypothetical protein LTR10_022341 [Elasticomyces elasticus]|uniref:DUF1445 domain-containing protein n=1 Tax=Exophiala sideris TaxID=1016849 RepID=A0A0D1VPH5_9EURO|nr:hypothetical protein LTR10_022341 [Elasticomyces elasticus]KAK5026872.1 hypothetical protein LTS07_007170 [Exophiala sideris]KAK5180818.1 hypothetical protein LTR44_006637 [Eurotiomycetes sp. CCFEE 6388]KAK5033876.1 hypothetical protein LTR13_006475 [Exophiala sideris]KAK5055849.1 hypothetical protein LTR69_008225 [Exophiala sideris]
MAPIAIQETVDVAPLKKRADAESATEETGEGIRLSARSGTYTKQTSGAAPTYIQANLIILPSKYASDFRILCRRNPVPCPLLAESAAVGSWDALRSWIPGVEGQKIAANVDLRHDCPRYMVYENGHLKTSHCLNVENEWTEDHVCFVIGCSFSFETALAAAGLMPAHTAQARNVSMYRTSLPLCPAGVFKNSTYIVSMRPYRRRDVEKVRDITRPYVATHGEPIDWGWEAVTRLGIKDISRPDYGEAPVNADGTNLVQGDGIGDEELVPVFWGCGVTPQEAVQRASLEGTVFGHAPGYMLVLDVRDWDILQA